MLACLAPTACSATGTQRGTQKAVRPGTQKVAPPPRTAGTAKQGTQRAGTQKSAAPGTRRAGGKAPAPAKDKAALEVEADQRYLNVTGYPFPLGPFLKRPTIRKEIVRGSIWGFEQPQSLGGSNVTTNIRMTVVRLQSGGLWVHAPIAPTRE